MAGGFAAGDGRIVADASFVRARLLASSSGFSLAETLIALTILASGLLSLAQLFTVSAASIKRARQVSAAAILASQKLEELRALPAAAEVRDEDRVEYLDRGGSVLPSTTRPAGAAYIRQWSMRPHAADPDHVTVISVRVTPGGLPVDSIARDRGRQAGEVVLVTMRTR